MYATEVGDIVGWASHSAVTSSACHPRLLLVAQQVTVLTTAGVTRRSETSSLWWRSWTVSRRHAANRLWRFPSACNCVTVRSATSPRFSVTASAPSRRTFSGRYFNLRSGQLPDQSSRLHNPAARVERHQRVAR